MYILQSLSSREYKRNEFENNQHTKKLPLLYLECTFLYSRKLIGTVVNIGLFEKQNKHNSDRVESIHILWKVDWDVSLSSAELL